MYVRTGEMQDAGTDSSVSLRLYGRRDDQTMNSGPVKLSGPKQLFKQGGRDNFIIKCLDLGFVSRLMVSCKVEHRRPSCAVVVVVNRTLPCAVPQQYHICHYAWCEMCWNELSRSTSCTMIMIVACNSLLAP